MRQVIGCVFVATCLGAFGADVYWSNAGTGNWETESNWQGGALPGVDDTAINDAGGTVLVADGMEQTGRYFTRAGRAGRPATCRSLAAS